MSSALSPPTDRAPRRVASIATDVSATASITLKAFLAEVNWGNALRAPSETEAPIHAVDPTHGIATTTVDGATTLSEFLAVVNWSNAARSAHATVVVDDDFTVENAFEEFAW